MKTYSKTTKHTLQLSQKQLMYQIEETYIHTKDPELAPSKIQKLCSKMSKVDTYFLNPIHSISSRVLSKVNVFLFLYYL